jgi:hypothetical protein
VITGAAPRTKLAHSGRAALQLAPRAGGQAARQRVPISFGRYTVSGWLATEGLATPAASLGYSLLDADGAVLATRTFARKYGTSPYSYHEAQIGPVKGAAFLEVAAVVAGSGTGRAFVDDLRIRDRNLLHNGGFEVRAANGQEDEAPGWAFVRGGRVVNDGSVRGQRALALTPGETYHFITQEIPHTSPNGYRVSAWVKTQGLPQAPTFTVTFQGSSGPDLGERAIPLTAGDSDYTFVSTTIVAADLPPGTASLSVAVGLAKLADGVALFDDVLVEPLPSRACHAAAHPRHAYSSDGSAQEPGAGAV